MATSAGPRSRTLATFRILDDAVLERARERALRPLDDAQLFARATELGIPVRRFRRSDVLARELLADIRRGASPGPALSALLARELAVTSTEVPDTLAAVVEWLPASDAERGAALRDLLSLVDAIPKTPRQGGVTFPRINSRARQ